MMGAGLDRTLDGNRWERQNVEHHPRHDRLPAVGDGDRWNHCGLCLP